MQVRIPDWYSLRGFARSGLGKASILFPVLPFVVDLLLIGENVSKTAAGAPVDFWASSFEGIQSFFNDNAGLFAIMYIGLGLFLAAKILFETAAPRSIKLHADAEAARAEILALLNATSHPRVSHYLQAEFFKVEDRIRKERWLNPKSRIACAAMFGVASLILVGPAVYKMVEMLGVWIRSLF